LNVDDDTSLGRRKIGGRRWQVNILITAANLILAREPNTPRTLAGLGG
jgi:hypothetical protein